jgi:hypothetical protein
VTLKHGVCSFTKEFLVDASADITLIPMWVGKALQLPTPESGEMLALGGLGGFVSTVHRTILLEIGSYRFEAKIAWAQSEEVPLLLGRFDVFDFFKITFDQTDRVTIFTRKKKAS